MRTFLSLDFVKSSKRIFSSILCLFILAKPIDQPTYRHKKVSLDDEVLLFTTFRSNEDTYDIEDQEQSTLQDHGFNFDEKEKYSLAFQKIKLMAQAQHHQKTI